MRKFYQIPVVKTTDLENCEIFTVKSGEMELVSSDDWYE